MRKIPTLFQRDWDGDRRYVLPEVVPGCEWVTKGEGTATRKYDGTCVMYDGKWWARREVKAGKAEPPGFVALEADPETGKTVGWEPVEQSSFARWHAEALADEFGIADRHDRPAPEAGATYELIGPKVNGNPEGTGGHVLARHGYMAAADLAAFRDLPLDFGGLAAWLHAHPYEGIVWHHPDGRLAKIKKRDFRAPAA